MIEGKRVASIDIGSNAMRLLIAECRGGKLETLEIDRASVGLGAEVFQTGFLSESTIARALEALQSFSKRIEENGVVAFRAIGTSALRECKNGAEFIAQARTKTGVNIEVIDGEEEARLVYLAVAESLGFSQGLDLLVDIGGGSVEITLVDHANILFSESFKMGTMRLLRLLGGKGVSPQTFRNLAVQYSSNFCQHISDMVAQRPIERFVGTGGNLETFLKLRKSKFNKEDARITISELEELLDLLLDTNIEERISSLGLRADRAEVVVPAAILMLELMRSVGVKELLVPGGGVREGVAYELLADRAQFSLENLRTTALMLGRRYDFNEAHALKVVELAVSIFNQTKDALHKLAETDLWLLELAAIMHDLGQHISARGHHKHSYYLIESSTFPGLTRREKLLVALIARYHRKSFPKEEHPGYCELSDGDKLKVRQLAAMLRIADGLDKDPVQKVQDLRVDLSEPQVVSINLKGSGDLTLDRYSAELKSDLFEQVFNRKVQIGATFP